MAKSYASPPPSLSWTVRSRSRLPAISDWAAGDQTGSHVKRSLSRAPRQPAPPCRLTWILHKAHLTMPPVESSRLTTLVNKSCVCVTSC